MLYGQPPVTDCLQNCPKRHTHPSVFFSAHFGSWRLELFHPASGFIDHYLLLPLFTPPVLFIDQRGKKQYFIISVKLSHRCPYLVLIPGILLPQPQISQNPNLSALKALKHFTFSSPPITSAPSLCNPQVSKDRNGFGLLFSNVCSLKNPTTKKIT